MTNFIKYWHLRHNKLPHLLTVRVYLFISFMQDSVFIHSIHFNLLPCFGSLAGAWPSCFSAWSAEKIHSLWAIQSHQSSLLSPHWDTSGNTCSLYSIYPTIPLLSVYIILFLYSLSTYNCEEHKIIYMLPLLTQRLNLCSQYNNPIEREPLVNGL